MKVHTIHEAKTNLSKLIRKACEGEEVILAKGKKPVAKIVPIADAQKKRVLGGFEGKVWASGDAFAPLTEEELRDWGLE
ncbi:MAG TPA: type II toxin-antitoxin system prevent-host-death family antitoxin [Candidatus Eisenbacteria bacterium]|nr:type II toxin-antitoxin system prevent-host-death family antitoxin [Candidatus Eisenbacteria bacterium]